MTKNLFFLDEKDFNFKHYSLYDLIEEINNLFDYSKFIDKKISETKINDELGPIEFENMWSDFVEKYFFWSAKFNKEIRIRIAKHKENDLLKFQKYCYLYQYWWITFHLLTKCFTNYNKEKIREFEIIYYHKIEVINNRLNSKELIDRFEQENFDYLKELEKMN